MAYTSTETAQANPSNAAEPMSSVHAEPRIVGSPAVGLGVGKSTGHEVKPYRGSGCERPSLDNDGAASADRNDS